jgi:hypothetical protein
MPPLQEGSAAAHFLLGQAAIGQKFSSLYCGAGHFPRVMRVGLRSIIFIPFAYLTRLCVGLLGGFWACWLLFAFGAYLARLFIGLMGGFWACWLLFTFGWLRWFLFVFGLLIPGLLCRGDLAGFNGSFGRAHHARRYGLALCWL